MLNYNTPIKENKSYPDLVMKEIKPIIKLIIRGKSKDFFTAIGKNVWKLGKNLKLPLMAQRQCTY